MYAEGKMYLVVKESFSFFCNAISYKKSEAKFKLIIYELHI